MSKIGYYVEHRKLIRRLIVGISFLLWLIITVCVFVMAMFYDFTITTPFTAVYATLTGFVTTVTSFYTTSRTKEDIQRQQEPRYDDIE